MKFKFFFLFSLMSYNWVFSQNWKLTLNSPPCGKITDYDTYNQYLIHASIDGTVQVRDKKNFFLLRKIEAHAGGATFVRCISNGSKIISAGYDNKIKIWETHTGKLLQEFPAITFVYTDAAGGKEPLNGGILISENKKYLTYFEDRQFEFFINNESQFSIERKLKLFDLELNKLLFEHVLSEEEMHNMNSSNEVQLRLSPNRKYIAYPFFTLEQYSYSHHYRIINTFIAEDSFSLPCRDLHFITDDEFVVSDGFAVFNINKSQRIYKQYLFDADSIYNKFLLNNSILYAVKYNAEFDFVQPQLRKYFVNNNIPFFTDTIKNINKNSTSFIYNLVSMKMIGTYEQSNFQSFLPSKLKRTENANLGIIVCEEKNFELGNSKLIVRWDNDNFTPAPKIISGFTDNNCTIVNPLEEGKQIELLYLVNNQHHTASTYEFTSQFLFDLDKINVLPRSKLKNGLYNTSPCKEDMYDFPFVNAISRDGKKLYSHEWDLVISLLDVEQSKVQLASIVPDTFLISSYYKNVRMSALNSDGTKLEVIRDFDINLGLQYKENKMNVISLTSFSAAEKIVIPDNRYSEEAKEASFDDSTCILKWKHDTVWFVNIKSNTKKTLITRTKTTTYATLSANQKLIYVLNAKGGIEYYDANNGSFLFEKWIFKNGGFLLEDASGAIQMSKGAEKIAYFVSENLEIKGIKELRKTKVKKNLQKKILAGYQ